jgi:hypothetical protein
VPTEAGINHQQQQQPVNASPNGKHPEAESQRSFIKILLFNQHHHHIQFETKIQKRMVLDLSVFLVGILWLNYDWPKLIWPKKIRSKKRGGNISISRKLKGRKSINMPKSQIAEPEPKDRS